MTDIFVSYKREDQEYAIVLVKDLEFLGYSVFFDVRIDIGESWDEVIESEIADARCVLVLWSPKSCKSKWVRREARLGQQLNKLCPALIQSCEVPLEFSDIQLADLTLRKPRDFGHPEWVRLTDRINKCLQHEVAEVSKASEELGAAIVNGNLNVWPVPLPSWTNFSGGGFLSEKRFAYSFFEPKNNWWDNLFRTLVGERSKEPDGIKILELDAQTDQASTIPTSVLFISVGPGGKNIVAVDHSGRILIVKPSQYTKIHFLNFRNLKLKYGAKGLVCNWANENLCTLSQRFLFSNQTSVLIQINENGSSSAETSKVGKGSVYCRMRQTWICNNFSNEILEYQANAPAPNPIAVASIFSEEFRCIVYGMEFSPAGREFALMSERWPAKSQNPTFERVLQIRATSETWPILKETSLPRVYSEENRTVAWLDDEWLVFTTKNGIAFAKSEDLVVVQELVLKNGRECYGLKLEIARFKDCIKIFAHEANFGYIITLFR